MNHNFKLLGNYYISNEGSDGGTGASSDPKATYAAYGGSNIVGCGVYKGAFNISPSASVTHYADGTDVPDGPAVSPTYPLGYFREDYEWLAHTGDDSYLDIHNGRFCITSEYPTGTYCYFATVDANHNSAYPYLVGPTFYGNKTALKVANILEGVTIYTPPALPIFAP